ncbi:helix-turn-helix domain-containing protein [Conexibacter stalactiti]|uniref:Helix-turn-helix domain-containing protein n=1 Tax=Conexibacter stalactiti TaxID=1940611 RepID=A0ABU4HL48_9ACTN|nr:helix-turn-helix domain-containing protein [Conexibacter stalactiti]MDW5594025.1 helix-turn-helix domain-containing protein [Conexibacter stalactiti]MEC5034667.1 helix-turn-helix domain-containing protein [Conexibacter stalactiti]
MRRVEIDTRRLVEVFSPDGLHGVGMVEIARATGVAKPTLYRNHPSKDALFLAAVEAEVERLLERLYETWSDALARAGGSAAHVGAGAGASRDPLADAIAALARELLAYGDEQPAGFRLLFTTAAHAGSTVADDVAGTLDRIVDRLTELLARHPAWHADPADAELIAGLLPAAAATALRRGEEPWDRDATATRIGALLRPPVFGA